MTEIDSDHAALLKAVASNTNNKTVQKAYADWLMEHNNPGYIVVLNYKPQDWPIAVEEETKWGRRWNGLWKLCWLDGVVKIESTSHVLRRVKLVLNAYANGEAR